MPFVLSEMRFTMQITDIAKYVNKDASQFFTIHFTGDVDFDIRILKRVKVQNVYLNHTFLVLEI